MVKNLKSLLAGTALLSLVGCTTPEITVHHYPSHPRPPMVVSRTEYVYFSIQNIPSHRHHENFRNPTYNGWRPETQRHGHHDYSGHRYRK